MTEDQVIIVGVMRDQTICAVFYSLFRIPVIPSAALSKRIKWAIAKQAVKVLRVCTGMTGKVLTLPVAEEFVMLRGII